MLNLIVFLLVRTKYILSAHVLLWDSHGITWGDNLRKMVVAKQSWSVADTAILLRFTLVKDYAGRSLYCWDCCNEQQKLKYCSQGMMHCGSFLKLQSEQMSEFMNKLDEFEKKTFTLLLFIIRRMLITLRLNSQITLSGVVGNNWNFSSQWFQSERRNIVRVTGANETRHSLFIRFSLWVNLLFGKRSFI